MCRSVTEAFDPFEVDAELPAVGLEHLPRRSTTLRDWGRAADLGSRKYRFQPGDTLFGKIRPYFHKVAMAPMEGICSTDAIVVRALDEQLAGYVLAVASSDQFVAHAVATSNGTKMPRADWKVLSAYPVSAPPQSLLREWASQLEGLAWASSALAMQNSTLRDARDELLPRLISAQIDVNTLQVDDAFGWTELAAASI